MKFQWYNALNIEERNTLFKKYKSTKITITDDARVTKKMWEEIPCLSRKGEFSALLNNINLTDRKLLELLSISANELSKNIETNPKWARTSLNLRISSIKHKYPSFQPSSPYSIFLLPVKLVIDKAEVDLEKDILKIVDKNNYSLINFTPILKEFRYVINEKLTEILIKPIVTEMHIAGKLNILLENNSSSRFNEFFEKFSENESISNFLNLYPVAIRLSINAIIQSKSVLLEIITNIYSDIELPNSIFEFDENLSELKSIKFGLGDPHKNGKSVAIIEFTSGFKVVYKPRSLGIDLLFQSILKQVSSKINDIKFKLPKILNRDDYGYMEFIESFPCQSKEEIDRFYYRHGFQLAILYLLGGTDFHFENIIACGEHPVFVDLETLMTPKLKLNSPHSAEILADSLLKDSVLGTGLLPMKTRFDPELESIDISGLSGNKIQTALIRTPVWHEVETDLMNLKRELMPLDTSSNQPSIDFKNLNIHEYSPKIISGFTHSFEILKNNGDAIKQTLLNSKKAKTRIVLRPTYEYAFLLQESFHPYHLGNAIDRDRYFDQLWYRIKFQPELKKIYRNEKRDLWQGDIPFFSTYPNSTSLWTSCGKEIPNFFDTTGNKDALQRLSKLDKKNIDFQTWLIRLSLGTEALEEGFSVKKHGFEVGLGTNAIYTSLAIGDYLIDNAIINDDEATWVSLVESDIGKHTPVIAGTDLYAGLPGIILFLVYLSKISGHQKYYRIAKAGLNNFKMRLEHTNKKELSCGAFDGIGGIIYSLSHFEVLFNDKSLINLAKKFILKVEKMLENNPNLDIINGASGCILGLLSHYSITEDEVSLQVAKQYGDYILNHKNENGDNLYWLPTEKNEIIDSGFGHGAMGVVYALHQLYLKSKIDKYRLPSDQILKILQNIKDKATLLTVDNISENNKWCRGLSGSIGSLTRLYPDLHLDGLMTNLFINSNLTEFDCTCHGEMGNLDVIIGTKTIPSNNKIMNLVYQRLDRIMSRVNRIGFLCGTPVESVGFMEGLSGIGYQLLRIKNQSEVPSVLFLEPPIKN